MRCILFSLMIITLSGCFQDNDNFDAVSSESTTTAYFYHVSSLPAAWIIGDAAANSGNNNHQIKIFAGDNPARVAIADNITGLRKIGLSSNGSSSAEISQWVVDSQLPNLELAIAHAYFHSDNNSLTDEALALVDSITIIIEGSSIIDETNRLDNILRLADKAVANGVSKVYLQMFESIDIDQLVSARDYYQPLLDNPNIELKALNFNTLRDNIQGDTEIANLASLIDFFGYTEVAENAFTASSGFDKNKETLVYFGSSRTTAVGSEKGEKGANFNNVKILEHYLADAAISQQYNIAIKPHPRATWIIDEWLSDGSKNVSYFSSIPYEILILISGKSLYDVDIPTIERVDSTYSTILFSVAKENVFNIVDYSNYSGFISGDLDQSAYVLLDEYAIIGFEDEAEKFLILTDNQQATSTHLYRFINP